MHIGSRLAESEGGFPNTLWYTATKLSIDGVLINIDAIRSMQLAELNRATQVLFKQVLLGFPIEDAFEYPEWIYDDANNRNLDYSLFDDLRNSFYQHRHAFCKWLVSHPVYGPIFGFVGADGKFVWNIEAVKEWLEQVYELKKHLFLLVHTTSGLPQRGTEVSATQFANSLTATRNLFSVMGRISIVGSYNKTSHNAHRSKPLPRALQSEVSRLSVVYLALARPLEQVVVHLVAKPEHCQHYRTHLWAERSGLMNTQTFNSILNAAFKSHVGVEMTMGRWRHTATAISRRYLTEPLRNQPDLLADVVDAMADKQMGHSTQIAAAFYAVETPQLGLTERELQLFFLVSRPFASHVSETEGFQVSDLFQSFFHLKELDANSIRELMGIDGADAVPKLSSQFLCRNTGPMARGETQVPPFEDLVGRVAPAIEEKIGKRLVADVSASLAANIIPAIRDTVIKDLLPYIGDLIRQEISPWISTEVRSSLASPDSTFVDQSADSSILMNSVPFPPVTPPSSEPGPVELYESFPAASMIFPVDLSECHHPDPYQKQKSATSFEFAKSNNAPALELSKTPKPFLLERHQSAPDDIDLEFDPPDDIWDSPCTNTLSEEVDPGLLGHLRRALGDNSATWRSREQAAALQQIVYHREKHSLTVLATGGGKTFLYTLPAIQDRGQGVYIVIVANRSLIEDLLRRLPALEVKVTEWKPNACDDSTTTPVVLVSADFVCNKRFEKFVLGLTRGSRLSGVMVDEAHKWVTEVNYRFRLQDPTFLSRLGVPIHFFTATVRPGQEWKIETAFGLLPGTCVVTRGSIDRPNIGYRVIRASPMSGSLVGGSMSRAIAEARSMTLEMQPGMLGLIICRDRVTTRRVASELGCGAFHAKTEEGDVDPQIAFVEWQKHRLSKDAPNPAKNWLSATTLVDTGNDTRGLSYTLFVEPPWTMVNLLQGAGRTAREGQPGTVVVVYDGSCRRVESKGQDEEFADVDGVKEYVENMSVCRRLMISRRWDKGPVSCAGVPHAVFCDICKAKEIGVQLYVPVPFQDGPRVAEVHLAIEVFAARKEEASRRLLVVQTRLPFEQFCPFHFALEGQCIRHPIQKCDLSKTPGPRLVRDGFEEFRNSLQWQPGYVCYRCFFPHPGKDDRFHTGTKWKVCSHSVIRNGDRDNAWLSKTFVSGLLWRIFHSMKLRENVADLPHVPETIELYYGYLTGVVGNLSLAHWLIATCLRAFIDAL